MPVDDNTIFNYEGFECIIDNSVNDLQIEIEYIDGITDIQISRFNEYYYVRNTLLFPNMYKLILDDFKNKRIRSFNDADCMKITLVTMSEETQNKLDYNYKKLEEINRQNQYNEEINNPE